MKCGIAHPCSYIASLNDGAMVQPHIATSACCPEASLRFAPPSAGDNDDAMVQTCTEAKDQAAVLSILFHTRRIIEEYGVPAHPSPPAQEGKQ